MPRCDIAIAWLMCLWMSVSSAAAQDAPGRADGIQFRCAAADRVKIKSDMRSLFRRLHISERYFSVHENVSENFLTYTLTTPADDTSTLDFTRRPEYRVHDQAVSIYGKQRRPVTISTVSLKEILLALMQHGRLTEFSGAHCSAAALIEHMRLRQTIVAWVERVEWAWPDGGPSEWNRAHWGRTGVRVRSRLFEAFEDAFVHQEKYSVGCYAATKLVYAFGMMDFYRRVAKNPKALARIQRALNSGGGPLAGIEPHAMWSFESDYDPAEASTPGKLLYLQHGVGKKNFVPGDWVYFVNTDASSSQKVGYEGSNGVYLGRGYFSDFYNDVEHHYTYEQKLDEVYQWRHGVFSQSRDYDKAVFLSPQTLDGLSNSIDDGGIVLPLRAVPSMFH